MILIWLYRNWKKQDLHDRFYIHCDGALFGLMMPFVKLVSIPWFSIHCSLSYQKKGSEHSLKYGAYVVHILDFCRNR